MNQFAQPAAARALIIGAGPAGLFAAATLSEALGEDGTDRA